MCCVESTGRPRGVGREVTMRYVPTLLRTKVGNAVTASIVIFVYVVKIWAFQIQQGWLAFQDHLVLKFWT